VHRRIEVEPRHLRAWFLDFPVEGQDGFFDAGAVSLIDRSNGEPVSGSPEHRTTFDGLAKYRRWSPLDSLYFFGYALCTYFSVPFILPELPVVGMRRVTVQGKPLTGVTVAFPEGFPTHSEHQTFFFDDTGLLRRHDYSADVVGSWATGAHFSEDYEEVNGLHFARRRFVRATLFGRATPIPVLHARLASFEVSTAVKITGRVWAPRAAPDRIS
jgi:hypothetical protein